MRLSTVDLERLRVADIPDFGYELALGGAQLADRTGEWTGGPPPAGGGARRPVGPGEGPGGRGGGGGGRVGARGGTGARGGFSALSPRTYPRAFSGRAPRAPPAGIDPQSPAATAHLRDLARSGVLT